MRRFFDTNILVYAYDHAAGSRHERAQQLLAQNAADGSLVLSTQVLQEFCNVSIRKLRHAVRPASLERMLEQLEPFCLIGTDPHLLSAALRRHLKDGVSYYDAIIVEGALLANCDELLNEDLQHGRRFGTLTVRNPFL